MKRSVLWPLGLSVFGLVLIISSVIWIVVIEPGFEKLPTDLDETFQIKATVNQTLPTASQSEVIVERVQEAAGTRNGALIIREKVTPATIIPGIIEPMTLEMAVDRDSRKLVSGFGDKERSGYWAYPIGTKRQAYPVWSDSANSAPDAVFAEEEKIEGLKVYKFITNVTDLPAGKDPMFGLPLFMDMVIEEKVEPYTGIVVYGKSVKTFKVQIPPEMRALLPPDMANALPPSTDPKGPKVTALILSQEYTEETIAEKVDDAKHYRALLLWATRYGLWLGIGFGVVFLAVGGFWTIRARRSIRQSGSVPANPNP